MACIQLQISGSLNPVLSCYNWSIHEIHSHAVFVAVYTHISPASLQHHSPKVQLKHFLHLHFLWLLVATWQRIHRTCRVDLAPSPYVQFVIYILSTNLISGITFSVNILLMDRSPALSTKMSNIPIHHCRTSYSYIGVIFFAFCLLLFKSNAVLPYSHLWYTYLLVVLDTAVMFISSCHCVLLTSL